MNEPRSAPDALPAASAASADPVDAAVAPSAPAETFELVIEKLVAGGDGLGRHLGVPVFVPTSAPGDRLLVRVVERRREYARAVVEQVLVAGPGRRDAPCPVFERCGGCDLQHLDEATQLEWKSRAALETLERLSGIADLPRPEMVSGASWGYRRRAQLQVDRTFVPPRVGFFARGTHDVVDVERCPVLVPALDAALAEVRRVAQGAAVRRLDVVAGDAGELSTSPPLAGLPQGEVSVEVRGVRLSFDARSFFQGHRELLGLLVDRAVGDWSGEAAFDLYAGVGLFSLALAARYRRVTAVESDGGAVRYLRINARRNHRELEIVGRSVDAWIRSLPPEADRVLVDPPRAGLALPVVRVLADRRPRRLTYVSCHVATLARDLKELARAYRVESITWFDLFPQTGHLEAVVQLERRD
jgi:23S rRNA (uracil1939-C5)-methyltransferase